VNAASFSGLKATAPSAAARSKNSGGQTQKPRRPDRKIALGKIVPENEEAGCRLEEWKDFLRPHSPLDPEPGLGGILSVGLLQTIASSFSNKISSS
jgi:hypothetical protein